MFEKIIIIIKNYLINKFKIMDKNEAKKQLDKLQSDFEKYSRDVTDQMKKLSAIIESPNAGIKIPEDINDYKDILKIWGTEASDDEVSIKGFDAAENNCVSNIIKKIRTVKVYNGGKALKLSDERWYSWYNVSSGFVFNASCYGDANANTASASRLALNSKKNAIDFTNKFQYIDEGIIK